MRVCVVVLLGGLLLLLLVVDVSAALSPFLCASFTHLERGT